MNPTLNSKLPEVGTTIFAVIGELANQHRAINLGQGFPDFSAPQELLDRVNHHVQAGHNQYAPLAGIGHLREAIADKIGNLYGRAISPEREVTVTPGATEALYCAITACVTPGDEVIMFDPAYDSYDPAVTLSGGRPIHLPLQLPDFSIDWQRVKDAITSRTRMIILNSPHNPSGATLSAEDLQNLAELVRDTDILLLSDEVYEHLVYDGRVHQSLLRHDELAARAFVVFSFGKTYHVTGWKTGYCIAPPDLTAELRKVHQYVSFVAVTPIQHALADFMRDCPEHYQELPAFYQHKRDLFCRLLQDSRFRFTPTAGTFFQLVDYSEISDRDDMAMAEWLTREKGVAAIPVSVFYKEPPAAHYVRLCFAKEDETLTKAAELLCRI